MVYPPTYRYTKDDEWIDVKGESGTIGLTHEAQCRLGDIVFLELPPVGTTLEAGKPLGVVESVKAVFEIFSPVSGEVIEVNDELKNAPEQVNSDPHGAGWLIKVRLKDPTETDRLMDATAYEAYAASPSRESSH
jgi:glycine cleavage system H protein